MSARTSRQADVFALAAMAGFFIVALSIVPSSRAQADEWVGAQGCGSCHAEALEAWRRGPHARAERRLARVQRQDPRCQTCHSPRGDEGLVGVQCESCHGVGTYYARSFVMRDAELAGLVGLREPSEALCLRCHAEAPALRPFVFAEARLRIRHWPKAP